MSERFDLISEDCLRLWNSANNGNRGSLERLLREHQDLIFRFCRSRLADELSAIEATQETALRIISKLGSFQGKGKLSTWILGIANNVCREARRQNQKWQQQPEFALSEIQQLDEPHVDESEERNRLKQAVERLPDRQREAIILRYFESLSLTEVAEIMRISVGTVKATINHAMQKLKLELKQSS